MRIIQAPERYVITIRGNLADVRRRWVITQQGLTYHMERLLLCDEVAVEGLEAYGLRVEIEEDTDQGPEDEEALRIWG